MLIQEVTKNTRLQQKLWRELGGKIGSLLETPSIVEIMLNPDGKLWFQDRILGLCHEGDTFSSMQAMNLIGTVASIKNTVINEQYPILECELPFLRHRFEAVIPPIVEQPSFCIRKRAEHIYTLENYVDKKILTATQANGSRNAVRNRLTILVVGGPGTGKTTFANALLHTMTEVCDPNERILILEDTRELQSSAVNTVFLQTSDTVDFQKLLRATLRLRPDKICMGECRGVEMLTLLKCWNTGTPGGLATLHANSSKAALIRVQEMIAEGGSQPQPQLIAEAINVIVALSFHPTYGRKVQDILCVRGYSNQDFQLAPLSLENSSLCLTETKD